MSTLDPSLITDPLATGPAPPDGCYYCGQPINPLAGDPGQWPLMFCHADDPGRVKPHHADCVTMRLAQGEVIAQAHEAQEAALSTADQLVRADEELIQELEKQLAEAEADRTGLRMQALEQEALLQQMKQSLSHEVMEAWRTKCRLLSEEVKRLNAGHVESERQLLQWQERCAKAEAALGVVAQMRRELTGAASAEEVSSLRLKAADRDSWQEVALRLRAELDMAPGNENNLALHVEQKRCVELEQQVAKAENRSDAMERAGAEQAGRADENYEVIKQLRQELEEYRGLAEKAGAGKAVSDRQALLAELERAKTDRNKAGAEERRKYLPLLQGLADALRKERSALAAFLVPWKFKLDQSWLDHFVEAGSVTFDSTGYVKAVPVSPASVEEGQPLGQGGPTQERSSVDRDL